MDVQAIPYDVFVRGLRKPGSAILAALTPVQADLLHMAVGVAGEGGELLDAIKAHTIYQKPIDIENVIEELGDLEFFMEGVRDLLGIDRDATIAANKAKLAKRYEKLAYSDAEAINRADKAVSP